MNSWIVGYVGIAENVGILSDHARLVQECAFPAFPRYSLLRFAGNFCYKIFAHK